MSCSFFLKITEDKYNYYIAIDVKERERARYLPCPGRMWNRLSKEWVYPRTAAAYRAICDEFGEYPEKLAGITPPDAGGAGARPLQNAVLPATAAVPATATRSAPPAPPAVPVAPAVTAAPAAPAIAPAAPAVPAVPAADSNQPKQPPPVPTNAAGTALKFPAPSAKLEDVIGLLNAQARATQRISEQLAAMETSLEKLQSRPAPGATELADAIRPLLASLDEKIGGENILIQNDNDANRHVAAWLHDEVVGGAEGNPVVAGICSHWNLIKDFHSVVNDIEEQLTRRLREMLGDDGNSKKNLHKLCDDAFVARLIDKECASLLNAFRRQRNKITHKAHEGRHRLMMCYLHALSAFALAWPMLGDFAPPSTGGGGGGGGGGGTEAAAGAKHTHERTRSQ